MIPAVTNKFFCIAGFAFLVYFEESKFWWISLKIRTRYTSLNARYRIGWSFEPLFICGSIQFFLIQISF